MNDLKALTACTVLAALTAISVTRAHGQTAPGMEPLTKSRVFLLEQMPERRLPNGVESWDVLHGALSTGEVVALHETLQPAGAPPVPLHTIHHSELIVVQQGTVAFEHDNTSEQIGPGGVIFVAIGTNHRLRNAGSGPARYTVFQIGGDTKK